MKHRLAFVAEFEENQVGANARNERFHVLDASRTDMRGADDVVGAWDV